MVVVVWFGVSGESGPFFAGSPPQSPDSPSPIANLDCRWCCPGPPSSPRSTRSWCTRCSRSCSSAGAVQTQTQIHPDQTRPDQTRSDPGKREVGTVLRTGRRDRHKSPGAQAQTHRLTDSSPSSLSHTHSHSHTPPNLLAAGKEDRLSLGAKPFNFQPVFSRRTTHAASQCR